MSRVVTLAAAGVVAIATAAAALGYIHANGGPSPGTSAGVSALTRVPAQFSLPPDVLRFVQQVAPFTQTDPTVAVRRTRRLRTNLGKPGSDLYAFRGNNGAVCFTLQRQLALCPRSANSGEPGLQWAVGGGMPGEAASVVAIVADNVATAAITAGSDRREVPIINNTIYAPLPVLDQNDDAHLVVSYVDGSTQDIPIGNPATG